MTSWLVLVLLATGPYLLHLDGPFAWDDHVLLDSPGLRDSTAIPELFTRDYTQVVQEQPGWRPLANLTHMLDFRLWGDRPAGHRLTSLTLHVLCVVLLYHLLRQVAFRDALMAAALWAVHPAHGETIFCACLRRDSLAALGVLGALLLWRAGRFVPAALAWGLGLLGKETALVLPLLLLLHDRLLGPPPGRRPLLRYAPFLAVGLLYGAQRLAVLTPGIVGQAGMTVTERLNAASLPLQMLLWPWPHRLDYVAAANPWPALLWGAWGILLWRAGPVAKFGLLWLALALLPVSPLVSGSIASVFAERYLYLPSMGVAIALAAWLASGSDGMRQAARVAGGMVIALYVALTVAHGALWQDELRLYTASLAAEPGSGRLWYNLGVTKARLGDARGAADAYRRVAALSPALLDARHNLGALARAAGRLREAEAEFHAVLARRPNHGLARRNLADMLAQQGRTREALAEYRMLLRSSPRYIPAHEAVADLYARTGRPRLAAAHLAHLEGIWRTLPVGPPR